MEDKQELEINRLILVGNGFDLALGLNTTFADFIFWLKKRLIIKSFDSPGYNNGRSYRGYLDDGIYTIKMKDITSYQWQEWMQDYERGNKSYKEQLKNYNKFIKLNSSIVEIIPSSNFIKAIDKDIEDLGWVNIEHIFYQNLKTAKNNQIKELNTQLVILKGYLRDYLFEEQNRIPSDIQKGQYFFSAFRSLVCNATIYSKEYNPEIDMEYERLELGNIQFVNFNYTNTVSKLIKQFDAKQELITNPIIQIHGGLDDSMVFGYGDEEDDDYPRLEKTGENRYLEHVKSFRYLQNSDYYDLIRFINSGPYQILVLGHSCGLSDRTMLKELFENENCLSIKPLYYQWTEVYEEDGEPKEISRNDYFDKVMEISRHFSVNGMMRKKVVSFDKFEAMPQIKNIQ